MKKAWTAHCTSTEEKELFIQRLAYSQDVFNVLKNILQDKLDVTSKSKRSVKSFLTQDWAHYQADRNATERTLLEIIELLPTLEK